MSDFINDMNTAFFYEAGDCSGKGLEYLCSEAFYGGFAKISNWIAENKQYPSNSTMIAMDKENYCVAHELMCSEEGAGQCMAQQPNCDGTDDFPVAMFSDSYVGNLEDCSEQSSDSSEDDSKPKYWKWWIWLIIASVSLGLFLDRKSVV